MRLTFTDTKVTILALVELLKAGADPNSPTLDTHRFSPYELARILGPEGHTAFLERFLITGKEVASQNMNEIFWDTCGGECTYGKRVFYPATPKTNNDRLSLQMFIRRMVIGRRPAHVR